MLQRAASLTRTKVKGRSASGEVEERRIVASDATAGISVDVMLASLACSLRSPRTRSRGSPQYYATRQYRCARDYCALARRCQEHRSAKSARFDAGASLRCALCEGSGFAETDHQRRYHRLKKRRK